MTQGENERSLTQHGGRLDVAAALYPDAPNPWIDLSTGINPVPWRAPEDLPVDSGPLPSGTSLRALEDAAAACFGVDPSRVVALPGSEIGLRLLPFAGLPQPLLRVAPGYGTHEDVSQGTIALDALAGGTRGAVLLANPNNPDGRVIARARLAEIAEAQMRAGGWLIVDEAFADADPDLSALPLMDRVPRLVVFRSFGKFFGLAGLRLGFVVAAPDVCRRYRALLGDWPVSAQAIALGTAAYRDTAWIARTRVDLDCRAARLDALLARHGLCASGGCPLFRLVDHPGAATLFARLAAAGILTRAFDYAPGWLRFGLPADDAAFDRLDRALAGGALKVGAPAVG